MKIKRFVNLTSLTAALVIFFLASFAASAERYVTLAAIGNVPPEMKSENKQEIGKPCYCILGKGT